MQNNLVVITPPAAEPVELADLKLHGRIDDTTEDALIPEYITSAREWAEKYCRRAFIETELLYTLDRFPRAHVAHGVQSNVHNFQTHESVFGLRTLAHNMEIRLPRSRLISLDSLQFVDDTDEALKDVPASVFETDTIGEPTRIRPKEGEVWPTEHFTYNAVQVGFKAGYGLLKTDVPQGIRTAIEYIAMIFFEHRDPTGSAFAIPGKDIVNLQMPNFITAMLDRFRVK